MGAIDFPMSRDPALQLPGSRDRPMPSWPAVRDWCQSRAACFPGVAPFSREAGRLPFPSVRQPVEREPGDLPGNMC